MKTWNLGNTTVRNPERIRDALRIFKEQYEGKTFDVGTQNQFFNSLIAAGVAKGDPSQPGSRDLSARKWASAFNKLGFALPRGTVQKPVVTITEAGNALLSNEVIESDIFLRQMLKIQLPSPTEDKLNGASIHPFFLVLSVGVKLEENGMKPMTKEEIAIFIQSATNDSQADEIIIKIKAYRNARNEMKGSIAKRRYFIEQSSSKVMEMYGDINQAKVNTLQDYSDTTVRYSAITGIFTMGRQSLQIKEDQLNLAKAIVAEGPPPILDQSEFWLTFHNPHLPELPTDNANFLEVDIKALTDRLQELSEETGAELANREVVSDINVLQLKRRRVDLELELITQKEMQFYRQQNLNSQVEDIKNLFESIQARETIGGSDYRPAWAEWGVWRVFLSINTIANSVSSTRGFKINSELYPVHHAKGGSSDLLFEYDDGTIVPAEITLSTDERQFNMEGEAVKFHVKSVLENNQDKDIIGVFTAPSVHVATAHEFFNAEFYSQKMNGVVMLDIIPLSFSQLLSLLPGQKNGCQNGNELLNKLRELIKLKEESADGAVWLQKISGAFK